MQIDELEKQVSDYENRLPVMRLTMSDGLSLVFSTPNRPTLRRVRSLFTKNPITLRWIGAIEKGSVLLDIGANVGIYTVIAAVMRKAKVYAFEPESQNFAILNQNLALNQLNGRVVATCAAVYDSRQLDRLYLSAFDYGASCHSFGAEVGPDLTERDSPHVQGCVSVSIDELIERGELEVPNYIKVSVDGFEHKVLAGASRTLERSELRALIVNINPGLLPHRELLTWLTEKAFVHDPIQARAATHEQGQFKGSGEYIFMRRPRGSIRLKNRYQPVILDRGPTSATPQHSHEAAMRHVLDRIAATPVTVEPFPHVVVDRVFPAEYYEQIQRHFPPLSSMVPIGATKRVKNNAYKERSCTLLDRESLARVPEVSRSFWVGLTDWLYHPDFINGVVQNFSQYIENRLAILRNRDDVVHVKGDGMVVSDRTHYSIGPHTDAPHRLISFLFYLPADDSLKVHGTSLYRPKQPDFACAGGPHYPFEPFTRSTTIGFLPNRLFVFPKTERSFHGVEPIAEENVDRRLLIYNVRLVDA